MSAGVDMTVFGNNWIRSPDGADALRVVKEFNEHAAELTAKHPKAVARSRLLRALRRRSDFEGDGTRR